MSLAVSKAEIAGKGPARATAVYDTWELRFLEYRLEVVGSWPDSPRKSAIMEAILGRLRRAGA